jgi:hypothetical protein
MAIIEREYDGKLRQGALCLTRVDEFFQRDDLEVSPQICELLDEPRFRNVDGVTGRNLVLAFRDAVVAQYRDRATVPEPRDGGDANRVCEPIR